MGKVFISYSHKNKDNVNEIVNTYFDSFYDRIWIDNEIEYGTEWKKEIENAISSATVVIFFVTGEFLNSNFIIDHEIPYILNRKNELTMRGYHNALTLMLVRTDECDWQKIPITKDLQIFNPDKPLSQMTTAEHKDACSKLKYEINKTINSYTQADIHLENRSQQERQLWDCQKGHCEIEMRFQNLSFTEYIVEVIFSYRRESVKANESKTFKFTVDYDKIKKYENNSVSYGKILLDTVFKLSGISKFIETKILNKYPENICIPLSVRLCIYPNALELHALNWELLNRKDIYDSPFSHISHIVISRYLMGNHARWIDDDKPWHDVELKAKKDRISVLFIDISNILIPELEKACRDNCTSLGLDFDKIDGIDNFFNEMNKPGLSTQNQGQKADIVFFVCNGQIANHDLKIKTDPDDQEEQLNSVKFYINKIVKRYGPPKVMIACPLWAQEGENKSCGAFIPNLTRYGIPGILILPQGCSHFGSLAFFNSFFKMLLKTGRLDYSLGYARSVLTQEGKGLCGNYLLLTRKRTSRVWYEPKFLTENNQTWQNIIDNINQEECTPVIGPAFCDYIFQSRKQLASKLAKDHYYPLALHERISLTHVMQYISLKKNTNIKNHKLILEETYKYMEKFFPDLSSITKGDTVSYNNIQDFFIKSYDTEIWNSFKLIAKRDFKMFITTAFHDFLTIALQKKGKKPFSTSFIKDLNKKSRKFKDQDKKIINAENRNLLNGSNPLIYHLFGQMEQKGSMLLTEDDIFDFLLAFEGIEKKDDKILEIVKECLVGSNLIFLGFKMEQWDFRVLMRCIKAIEGSGHVTSYNHVAIQIDPDDDYITDPGNAKKFIEKYFDKINPSNVNIYWGSPKDFLAELDRRITQQGGS